MSEVITQDVVDDVFKTAKMEWDQAVGESGLDEKMFISLNRDGWALAFLGDYKFAKEQVEKQGLFMPVLVEGIKITWGD